MYAHHGKECHMTTNQQSQARHWLRSRTGIVLLAFLGIMAFFLVTEYTAHVLGALPFLFVLLCPLLHFLLHGRHGGGHDRHPESRPGRLEGGER
jgi:Protein of unknown function (DUF2933)